jgi:hypothetical protein
MRVIPRKQPSYSGGRALPKRLLQERLARQAAIESAYCRYLHLECGHMSTLETDEKFSAWRPRKGVTWCEAHAAWVPIARPPEPRQYPAEPLF